jgi:glucose/arabinose dehydrogenase
MSELRATFVILSALMVPVFPVRAGTTPLTAARIATGLNSPVYITHLPGDFERLFILEQCGRIKILKNGAIQAPDFLNISAKVSCTGERGLLGLTFHPNYNGTTNRHFFVNYTDTAGRTVIARYDVSANPDLADGASELILLRIVQPFTNHNGGWIEFGSDGYLYIATGDGGDANDPGNRAQTITNQLLGKILRVDVNGDDFPADTLRNYAIPSTNPFVGITGDDEIWAYGLRNPWRCSFDRETHDLYIADVGQDAREEVSFQPASDTGGRNYGWRCMEGNRCTGLSGCTCNDPSLTTPIHEYNHQAVVLNSITGGYVYRGCAIPDLRGAYFFADYGRDQIWSFRYDGSTLSDFQERTTELVPDVGSIDTVTSFGEDAYGELYLSDHGGEIYKIVPDAATMDCNANNIPDTCDIAVGQSDDVNGDSIPDECQVLIPTVSPWGALCMALLVGVAGILLLWRRGAVAA